MATGTKHFVLEALPATQTLISHITTVTEMAPLSQVQHKELYPFVILSERQAKGNECLWSSFLLQKDYYNSNFCSVFAIFSYYSHLIIQLSILPLIFDISDSEILNIEILNVSIPYPNTTKIKKHSCPKEPPRIGH